MRRAHPKDDTQRTDCLQIPDYRDGGRGLDDPLAGELAGRLDGAPPGLPVTDGPEGGRGGTTGFTVP